ncbi:phospho-N-acetylmuramoyl-pentapeptide-transferase [Orientia chuto str. Dubai]|uniref:Phospho-N-acetylmuramoyl-pentapeptide-transferase n=1 Tax=Orientia chuto str. Dubai TaxID=1359168 RepID=A0A0F3MJ93_9RICK|nr:phospho-N-acetylmuramoyl-pentapeptide-transferase [Candidatus Orientia mediorientalis]KJV55716.1 phospho-N-acetylmuramoyl-pentapeptide-transferase [Orientia chuto str. Dubai]
MLYNLFASCTDGSDIFSIFSNVIVRSGIAILLSFIISFSLVPLLIKYFKTWKNLVQPIRNFGPKRHITKVGTPTMGGIAIIFSIILSTLILADYKNIYVLLTIFVMLSLAALGFIDDYQKVIKKNTKGISPIYKLISQIIVSIISYIIISYNLDSGIANYVIIPFFQKLTINLSILYIPLALFIIIGTSNAVNLTDGLDGLVTVPIIVVALCLGLMCYLAEDASYINTNNLQILHVPQASELTVLCSAIAGASLGFLWYNVKPAKIFMGDVGSLSLGGAIGIISIISKNEIRLAIIGGLFVIEALSVIIQLYSIKYLKGKRIFKMAPIHHHFEQIGWGESKIVNIFWTISIVFSIIGLSSLKNFKLLYL